jgi:hypothetical protein
MMRDRFPDFAIRAQSLHQALLQPGLNFANTQGFNATFDTRDFSPVSKLDGREMPYDRSLGELANVLVSARKPPPKRQNGPEGSG